MEDITFIQQLEILEAHRQNALSTQKILRDRAGIWAILANKSLNPDMQDECVDENEMNRTINGNVTTLIRDINLRLQKGEMPLAYLSAVKIIADDFLHNGTSATIQSCAQNLFHTVEAGIEHQTPVEKAAAHQAERELTSIKISALRCYCSENPYAYAILKTLADFNGHAGSLTTIQTETGNAALNDNMIYKIKSDIAPVFYNEDTKHDALYVVETNGQNYYGLSGHAINFFKAAGLQNNTAHIKPAAIKPVF